MTTAARALVIAARWHVVLAHLGRMVWPLAGLVGIPAGVALAVGDTDLAWRFGVTTVGALGIGLALTRLPIPPELRRNEAMAVVTLTFAIGAAVLVWPLMAAGVAPIDAVFEAVSGMTTTGLTTLATVEDKSAGFLFARAWSQWYGGLVVVVLALALVMEPGLVTKRLSTGLEGQEGDLLGGTRARAKRALAVYAALTVVGIAAVAALTGDPWLALLHVLTAISTAGFAAQDDGLASVAPAARAVLGLLSILGAVSLLLMWRAAEARRPGLLIGDGACRTLITLLVLGTAILWGFRVFSAGVEPLAALAEAVQLSVWTQTSTGFSTIDIATLDPASQVVLIIQMMIGGDAGSTSGGIKIPRLLVVLAVIRLILLRPSMPPHALTGPSTVGGRTKPEEAVTTLTILSLFLSVALGTWVVFLLHGLPPLASLFDVVSALGTVGLSAGVVGPDLPAHLKALLALVMLMGRLEVVAVLVLVHPATWFGVKGR
jgi:trk system potassium uptake protein TrkH